MAGICSWWSCEEQAEWKIRPPASAKEVVVCAEHLGCSMYPKGENVVTYLGRDDRSIERRLAEIVERLEALEKQG